MDMHVTKHDTLASVKM